MNVYVWIFGVPFAIFLIATVCFGPQRLPHYKYLIVGLFGALFGGLFAHFLTGEILLTVERELSSGGKLGIQSTGGIAVFVFVLLWWHRASRPKAVGEKAPDGDGHLAPIIETAMRDHITQLQGAYEEIGKLKEQLENAVRRAEEAERRGQPEAKGILESLRSSGNTASLLKFLVAERDRSKDNLLALNREIAAVAYLRGNVKIAESALDEVLRLAPDDLPALNQKGQVYLLRGNLKEAEKAFRSVLTLAQAKSDQAAACGNLGLIYYKRGELDEAEKVIRKALEISKQLGEQEDMASAYGNLGLIYQARDDLDDAEKMQRKALEINERLGRQEGMANANGNLGTIYETRGELGEAERFLQKALEINKQLGRQEGMANQYGNLGIIYQKRGELDEAEKMHRKSLEINERLGRQENMAIDYANLGTIYKLRGEFEKAGELWRKARDLYSRIGIPHMVEKVQGWLDNLSSGEK